MGQLCFAAQRAADWDGAVHAGELIAFGDAQVQSQAFDFVIFDAPPLLPVTDAIVIGFKVETILLVAKYGAHTLDELRLCQNRLKSLGGRLQGCVFNDIKLVGMGGIYGYYKYDYHYKYQPGDV